jgi:hypothetical protein
VRRPDRFVMTKPSRRAFDHARPRHHEAARRPPLTPEQSATAKEIARHIGGMREAGTAWDTILITVDKTWPRAPYRTVLAGLLWAQLVYEKRRQRGGLQ